MATNARSDRWRDWAMLVLAVWLFLSPWILGFAVGAPVEGEAATAGFTIAAWNAWILGVVIAVLALWAAFQFAEWHDWVNGVLGVWLVVSPWILGFAALTAALWNHVVVGVLIVVLAAWELWAVRHQPTGRTA
jgi:SPW repeat